jgi:predicted ArsR family transcriptional regulator
MSSTLQAQARALGDPTRHRVFRYLADADHPVRVAELTAEFGLNHNAIRQHLAKLVDAELVVERIGSSAGRGRPPLVYEVDPSAPSRWDIVGPYERLALWLAEVVSSGDSPIEVGRRAGRRQLLLSDQVDDPRRELVTQMARQGFDPVTASNGDVILHNCPFESTALADPDVVCNLHLGFAEGIAEQLGGVRIGGLQPHDPRHARCRLRVDTSVAAPTRVPPSEHIAEELS